MQIKDYEDQIRKDITEVIFSLIKENPKLPISAKARAGAEISSWLEENFVRKTRDSNKLLRSEQAPPDKTKNPWDARTFYKYKDHTEEIWIDFKACKLTDNSDSNPDIGTPNKIFKFIEEGGFYLLYIYVYYKEDPEGLRFVEYKNKLVKSYFLKDVSSKVRRTPTNQLQVNIDEGPEYRNRSEFIELLNTKVLEGLDRQLKKTTEKIEEVQKNKENYLSKNRLSEETILKNL